MEDNKFIQDSLKGLAERLDDLQEKITDLQEKLDKPVVVSEMENTTWPKVGDGYWYINEIGAVLRSNWLDDAVDNGRKDFGNCFRTEEEAEKAVEKLEAFKRLRDKGFKFCGSDDQTISYRINTGCWSFGINTCRF